MIRLPKSYPTATGTKYVYNTRFAVTTGCILALGVIVATVFSFTHTKCDVLPTSSNRINQSKAHHRRLGQSEDKDVKLDEERKESKSESPHPQDEQQLEAGCREFIEQLTSIKFTLIEYSEGAMGRNWWNFEIDGKRAGRLQIGFHQTTEDSHYLYLGMIEIEKEFRRQGLSDRIIALAIFYAEHVMKMNLQCMKLEACLLEEGGLPSHPYWAKKGFCVVVDPSDERMKTIVDRIGLPPSFIDLWLRSLARDYLTSEERELLEASKKMSKKVPFWEYKHWTELEKEFKQRYHSVKRGRPYWSKQTDWPACFKMSLPLGQGVERPEWLTNLTQEFKSILNYTRHKEQIDNELKLACEEYYKAAHESDSSNFLAFMRKNNNRTVAYVDALDKYVTPQQQRISKAIEAEVKSKFLSDLKEKGEEPSTMLTMMFMSDDC